MRTRRNRDISFLNSQTFYLPSESLGCGRRNKHGLFYPAVNGQRGGTQSRSSKRKMMCKKVKIRIRKYKYIKTLFSKMEFYSLCGISLFFFVVHNHQRPPVGSQQTQTIFKRCEQRLLVGWAGNNIKREKVANTTRHDSPPPTGLIVRWIPISKNNGRREWEIERRMMIRQSLQRICQ